MMSWTSRTQTVTHGYACGYACGMNSVTHGALERRHRKRVRECVCARCERGVRSWCNLNPLFAMTSHTPALLFWELPSLRLDATQMFLNLFDFWRCTSLFQDERHVLWVTSLTWAHRASKYKSWPRLLIVLNSRKAIHGALPKDQPRSKVQFQYIHFKRQAFLKPPVKWPQIQVSIQSWASLPHFLFAQWTKQIQPTRVIVHTSTTLSLSAELWSQTDQQLSELVLPNKIHKNISLSLCCTEETWVNSNRLQDVRDNFQTFYRVQGEDWRILWIWREERNDEHFSEGFVQAASR